MLKALPNTRYKLSLIGASFAAMGTLLACAPVQNYNGHNTSYQTQSKLPSAGGAYNRYGFNVPTFKMHELDTYNSESSPQSRVIQKFASAEDIRISPYVPPSQNRRGLGLSNLGPQGFSTPNLRPRFNHHLDGPVANHSIPAQPSQPQTQNPRNIIRAQPIVAPQNIQLQNTQQQGVTTKPKFAPSELDTQNFNVAPFLINSRKTARNTINIDRFETGQPKLASLPIPALPEAQKQVIRQEQSALLGIENKSIVAGPASLRQSLDSAFKRSSRLAAESLRVDEAEEVLKQAKARSKPRLEFRSAIGPRQSETTFAFSNTTVSASSIRRSAELDLTLPIYQGGRLRAQRSSAKLGIETARAAVLQTRGQIIQQTALAYLDVVRDRKLVALYQENVDLLREQQSSVAELLALNESTISEKALVDARLATQRIRLETGLGVLRESEARYRNLVGAAAPQNLPVPIFNLPLSLTEVQALAQQNSPELTTLINRAKSAEFDVDIAKSGNKPSLALQGILRGAEGQSETIDRNAAAELLLNLRVPISTGGEGKSRVRQAKIVRNRLNLEIRDTQDRLRDQIDQLWARKTASENSQTFNKTQIDATQFAVNTVAEQRSEGVATILDLLNVQQTLLDAKIQTVEAESRQDTASVQLLNLMGVYQ